MFSENNNKNTSKLDFQSQFSISIFLINTKQIYIKIKLNRRTTLIVVTFVYCTPIINLYTEAMLILHFPFLITGTGLLFCIILKPSLNRCNGFWLLRFVQKLTFVVFYPLVELLVKFVTIFTDQDEWKSLSMVLTGVEGSIEGKVIC